MATRLVKAQIVTTRNKQSKIVRKYAKQEELELV
jgi:hypothetical protein